MLPFQAPPARACVAGALLLSLASGATAADATSERAWQRFRARSSDTLKKLQETPPPAALPPREVADLKFSDLFLPIGDAGLEYSERLRALTGRRVRLTGFMVREERRSRGVFVLVSRPGVTDADVLATAVHVHVPPERAAMPVAFQPGPLVLVGVLELGLKHEVDGRNSFVRLRLGAADPEPSAREESP